MAKIHAERLRKLADHLENSRKLEKFSFAYVISSTLLAKNIQDVFNTERALLNYDPNKPVCGTVGCAMGEMPFCFPDEWHYVNEHNVLAVRPKDHVQRPETFGCVSMEQIASFFGLSTEEARVVFYPKLEGDSYEKALRSPIAKRLGIRELSEHTTAKRVATNLRKVATYIENREEVPDEQIAC